MQERDEVADFEKKLSNLVSILDERTSRRLRDTGYTGKKTEWQTTYFWCQEDFIKLFR